MLKGMCDTGNPILGTDPYGFVTLLGSLLGRQRVGVTRVGRWTEPKTFASQVAFGQFKSNQHLSEFAIWSKK